MYYLIGALSYLKLNSGHGRDAINNWKFIGNPNPKSKNRGRVNTTRNETKRQNLSRDKGMHLLTGVPWIVLAVGVAGIAAVNPIDARKRMEIFIGVIVDVSITNCHLERKKGTVFSLSFLLVVPGG